MPHHRALDACGAEVWREAVQTLLEPGEVRRSCGFADRMG